MVAVLTTGSTERGARAIEPRACRDAAIETGTQGAKMSTQSPNTVVLIHGLWMTPLSWENWIERYQNAGYEVIAPAWPGMGDGIYALHADPTPIEHLGIEEIIEHYDTADPPDRVRIAEARQHLPAVLDDALHDVGVDHARQHGVRTDAALCRPRSRARA
jgi:pimeloyl-ACP methyl ester carboxylesterase